jgi:muramoyltetrapeptide carboxypeptidase
MHLTESPSLKSGDTIAIVATARKVSREEMAPAITILSESGFNVLEGRHLYGQQNQFSGTDTERVSDFQDILNNPAIKAILIARGGYGTVRIIDLIDFSRFYAHPKWIAGFSDITVLHGHLHQAGIKTLHSPMAINLPTLSPGALNSFVDCLKGEQSAIRISGTTTCRKGVAEGILAGGNLSVLYSLLGSPSFPETRNRILFIEDLDEYLYHIDRMMQALKRAGKLQHLAGLIVGGMNDMNDNTIPFGKSCEEIISDAVSEYNFPVVFDFPSGHISNNMTLVMGSHVRLTVADHCIMEYL